MWLKLFSNIFFQTNTYELDTATNTTKMSLAVAKLWLDLTRTSSPGWIFPPISSPVNVFFFFQYPGKKGHNIKEHPEVPALLRLELWLGLVGQQHHWTARGRSDGEFTLYAESVSSDHQGPAVWKAPVSGKIVGTLWPLCDWPIPPPPISLVCFKAPTT